MKLRTIFIVVCTWWNALLPSHLNDFNVILEAKWQNLEEGSPKKEDFGGQWILAGSIIFKKKAKDTVRLSKIYLQWHGTPIDNLMASLYINDDDKKFLPIQDNLVCDGLWNKTRQTLILNFEKKFTLGPTNIFNLVLTVPKELEATLQQGSFDLLTVYLPEPYKIATHDRRLSLTFNKLPSHVQPTTHTLASR